MHWTGVDGTRFPVDSCTVIDLSLYGVSFFLLDNKSKCKLHPINVTQVEEAISCRRKMLIMRRERERE